MIPRNCICVSTGSAIGVGQPPIQGGGNPILEELTIKTNGEYLPDEGVDGFWKVVADVQPTATYDSTTGNLTLGNIDIII